MKQFFSRFKKSKTPPQPQTFFIKVDRDSIKPNAKAGQTSDYEYISSTGYIIISANYPSIEFMDERIKLVRTTTSLERRSLRTEREYIVGGMNIEELHMLADTLREVFPKQVNFKFENHYQEYRFLTPIPSHSYKYERTKVTCCHCGAEFFHDEIKDEYYDDSDEYSPMYDCCPKCKKADCVKLEFEDFEGIMLERAGLPKLEMG